MPNFLKIVTLFVGSFSLSLGVSVLICQYIKFISYQSLQHDRRQTTRIVNPVRKTTVLIGLALTVLGPGLSWILTQRLIFGLWFLLFLPILAKGVAHRFYGRKREAMEDGALSFFYGLQGLMQVGVSFPTALFYLSEGVPSDFATGMRGGLRRFERGKSLQAILEKFRTTASLKRSGHCLSILEIAYRHGFAMTPLLDRILPILEKENQGYHKEKSIRRGAMAQIGLAALIPWLLGTLLYLFQPEILHHFFRSSLFVPSLLLALVFQTIGGLALWKTSHFC